LPGIGGTISNRNKEALLEAEAAGIHVAIATGRRHRYAYQVLSELGLSPDATLISSNGSMTRTFGNHVDGGQLIEFFSMDRVVARELATLLRGLGTTVFTYDELHGTLGGDLVTESLKTAHPRLELWIKANAAYLREVCPLEKNFDEEDREGRVLLQGMIAGNIAEVMEAERRVKNFVYRDEVNTHRTEYPEWDMAFLDLMPKGISKGTALHNTTHRLGLKQEQVMAIGDNWNDIDMLEYAGHAVLMGNAGQEMKTLARARGWHITTENYKDGVAEVIESLLAKVW
jgi:hypothetical protein